MKPIIISIEKRDELKYLDHQSHAGIYTSCPDCGGEVVNGMISCPDEKHGCCVAHWGFGCVSCKAVFDVKYNMPDDGRPQEMFKTWETIGVATFNPRAISKLTLKRD